MRVLFTPETRVDGSSHKRVKAMLSGATLKEMDQYAIVKEKKSKAGGQPHA